MNGSRDLRRTVTLSQQLTMESEYDSPVNARGILNRNITGHWDGNSLRTASGRTLFDIINQDDNWKPVKDRIRLQRVGAAFSGGPSPDDEPPVVRCPIDTASSSVTNGVGGSRMASGHPSLKRNTTLARSMTRSVSVQPRSVESIPKVGEIVITEITDVTGMPDENEQEQEHENEKVEEQAKEDSSGQGAVSLMALLEQTDNQWDDDGPNAPEGLDFQDDGEEDNEDEGDREGIYHVCCVCMVRHKGAAFIPCGHTFCRLCSRELWVSRGNCPLCNGFIQEILDIF